MAKYIVLSMFLMLLILGCGSGDKESARYTRFDSIIDHGKPLAMGDERDVYVFVDRANWQALKPFIESSIEREIVLVYPEKYFRVILKSISEVNDYRQYRNLLFIGDLQ